MSQPFSSWTVLPHSPLRQIDDNILTTQGTIPMPLTEFVRTMSVVRLADGDLVVYSAIALDDREMELIEDFGRPSYLVVPTPHHRQDALIWKRRYPRLHVLAPSGASAKVEEVLHVDSTAIVFSDPTVHFVTVPGTEEQEAALVVETPSGTTIIVADLIGNLRHRKGLGGLILRMMGFTGDSPLISKYAKHNLVKDKSAVRSQLMSWAGMRELRRVIVGHGKPIENNAGATLLQLAAQM